MGFDNLTLVPIQTKLIEPSLLTAGEEAWLDDYHRQVSSTRPRTSPVLPAAARLALLLFSNVAVKPPIAALLCTSPVLSLNTP